MNDQSSDLVHFLLLHFFFLTKTCHISHEFLSNSFSHLKFVCYGYDCEFSNYVL